MVVEIHNVVLCDTYNKKMRTLQNSTVDKAEAMHLLSKNSTRKLHGLMYNISKTSSKIQNKHTEDTEGDIKLKSTFKPGGEISFLC